MLADYQLIEKLYESSNSQVYRARRQADGQSVVLKLLKERYPSPERIAWFKREYQVTQSLDLPGVVKAYILTHDQQQWLMVLEDFEGESLARLALAGSLALPDFLNLAIWVTEIVGQIHHQQIIHKDLNPANIVYNPLTQQLKLIDFGISTGLSREKPAFRNPNVLEGTLPYISPEQTGRMNRAIDYRTDFYSLGVTFYELLTGQLPFQTEDALELIHSHIARQPQPPHLRQGETPPLLSKIILKLMAKNAEDRYQSAHGLKADLQRCLSQWTTRQHLDSFPLGQEDVSDRFQLPQKLYGRDQEIETLLSTFERASISSPTEGVSGRAELLLVSGQAGVGKSALVQEIYKPLTRRRGYFVTGKFDQFRRNIPYSAFIGAFRDLVRQLLTEDEARLERWRNKLLASLGPRGQLLIEVMPEIELIIGPQPLPPPLETAEAQQRFTQLWQNFIDVFSEAEHPLIVFLDDLQWADGASLKLLERLVTASESHDLFFIGAYRDNEVRAGHPLQLTLDEMEKRGATINHISLAALELPPIVELTGDILSLAPEEAAPLARLILAKTGGNPFFINEFLKALYQAALIEFDHSQGRWHWDLAQIQAQAITGNVVELITGNVQKLPAATQVTLKLAACVGNRFQLQILALVAGESALETATRLWPALVEGLIFPLDEAYKLIEVEPTTETEALSRVDYKFAHDRIHQAVYSLIAEPERAKYHWQIGQLFLQQGTPAEQEERLFEFVNQLNSGRSQAQEWPERDRLAALNLRAAKKAKAAAAYEPAFKYGLTGLELLVASEAAIRAGNSQTSSANVWQRQYDLALELHLETVELAYLNADFELLEQLAEVTLHYTRNLLHKVKIYEVKIHAYNAQSQIWAAIKTALPILELLGAPLPEQPSRAEALRILEEARNHWAGRHIEQLIDLPEMTDPYKLAAMRLLSSVSSAAY
jgi:predicted ATPase/tRNA A-37 threonylcarbamoyl transferase component Bud32